MKRTRIKFCGLTRAEDVAQAVELGVDALGFVFTARSTRRIEPAHAAALARALPPFVSTVALFMDDAPDLIESVIHTLKPGLLQFHGSEDENECERYGLPYLKAVPMASVTDLDAFAAAYASATGFLLDAHAAGAAGGSGRRFDWNVAIGLERPIVVAGGLDAANVGTAIAALRPLAVDVSSGIESAPGIKDPARMQAFVAAVRAADAELAALARNPA